MYTLYYYNIIIEMGHDIYIYTSGIVEYLIALYYIDFSEYLIIPPTMVNWKL